MSLFIARQRLAWARLTAACMVVSGCDGCDNSSRPNLAPDASTGGAPTKIPEPDASTGGAPSTSPPDASTGCPSANGTTVEHATDVTTNETWAGDGTVHKITFGITVRPGATLTLAACAVVQVRETLEMKLRGDPGKPARLVSLGTASQPVLVTKVPGGANWGDFLTYSSDDTADLAYTTFESGGDGAYHGAALHFVAGADGATTTVPVLKVDHVTVKGAVGTGIVLESGASFTADSSELSIADGGVTAGGDGGSALEVSLLAAGTVPLLHASGNASDQIRIGGSLSLATNLTLKNVSTPYYFYFNRFHVYDPAAVATPVLTIEPGVTLRFDDYLQIGEKTAGVAEHPAKLMALGTKAQPITFTSAKAAPSAGDWPGIYLASAAGSRIENVRIEFAGGDNGIVSANCRPDKSGDRAALFLGTSDGAYIPSPADFVNVTIDSSAAHGINAMWTAADFGPDLTSGFTFGAIAGCRQTKNGRTNGCGTEAGCLVP